MRRLLAAAVTGVLLVSLVAADEADEGAPAAEPAQPTCAYGELNEPGWGSVRPIAPGRDDRAVNRLHEEAFVGFSIDRVGGAVAAVADARVLQLTEDAGCTWRDVLSFDGALDVTGQVEESSAGFLAVAVADGAPDHLVAFAYDLEYLWEARPRMLVSRDRGRSWVVGGEGLPELVALPSQPELGCGPARGCQLVVSPSDPDVVWLLTDDVDLGHRLFRSEDGGLSFEAVAGGGFVSFDEARRPGWGDALAVHPDDADRLWLASGDDLWATSNGGRTWHRHQLDELLRGQDDARRVAGLAVAETGHGTLLVAHVVGATDDWTVVSEDRAATWQAFPADMAGADDLIDLTARADGAIVLATTDRGASRLDLAGRTWEHLRGSSLGPLDDIHVVEGTTTSWYAGPMTLPVRGDLTFMAPPMPPELGLDFEIPPFDPLDPPEDLDGSFVWDAEVIQLPVGGQRTVDVLFALPLRHTKLDVFFLFDQSGSMSEEMEALARGMSDIVRELGRRDVNVWAGLGGYSGGWRYIRHADIQDPGNPAFRRALNNLTTGGGWETSYTALHQVATGTGLPDSPAGFGPDPGWNANWRPGAVRIVVNLTDEPLQAESDPTISEAVEALQERQIKVINLISDVDTFPSTQQGSPTSVDRGIGTDHPVYGPAAALSKATNALAGPSGVDCGGDGEVDIPQGGPIACFVTPLQTVEHAEQVDVIASFADVMVEILEGVTEEHLIEFFRSDAALVPEIRPLDPTFRDVRKPASIRLKVTTACDRAHAGAVHDPLITAVASSDYLAATRLVIACDPLAMPAAEVPAPAPPQVPAAVAAAPAPPPPAPVQAPAPANGLAQAANPATAQALTPQVGVAAATQQQRQVRTASLGPAQPSADEGVEFAYTARRSSDPGPATVLAGAAMASVVGAAALRRRRAGVHATARATARAPISRR